MKTRILLIMTIISIYSLGSLATVADNATIREVPSLDSKGKSQSILIKHPDYKKLVDNLRELQEKFKTANDKSAAIGRQRVDVAFNRLREYIDAGKPTFLTINQSNITSTRNLTQEDACQKYIAAYNKLTKLMADNRGDTLEMQEAYQKYKYEKDRYEKILNQGEQNCIAQTEEKTDNNYRDLVRITQDESNESPIFLSDDMYQFYKTPAQITYYVVIDYLFKEGDVSNVGSPEIKTKQVTIDVVLHGKKQKIRFLESSRMDDVSEVLVEQVAKDEVMLIQLQKIKGKWAIIPDALDGSILGKKKEINKQPLNVTEAKEMTEKEAYEQYMSAYNKLVQLTSKHNGETPREKNAYEKYKISKERYENILKANSIKK